MKLLNFIAMTVVATMFAFNCTAQNIANAKTETVKIYGNCGMCEKTIEKAAARKGTVKADWDTDTKMAKITFDSTQATLDDVLKHIAAAGYDSEKFRAPDEVYANLHGCCQYDRPAASAPTKPSGMVKKKAMPTCEPPKS
ncbi:MAG: heavy-metal-associated domain-containing protein [Saprospiraceae bacterium]|nr:heavy-metal-associated domain-containing protein [Saprospiraceae bacterium]